MKHKNILFFFTDQQRWDTCGCYGQPLDITPHLDAMAAEGTLFSNAFTCQPVCGPARSCLQTGLYATRTGCYRNDIGLPRDARTIAHLFGDAGYRTGYIGKWHLASTDSGDADANVYGESMQAQDHGRGRVPINFHQDPVVEEFRGGWKDQWIVSDVLEFTSHGYDGHMFDKENKRIDFPDGAYRPDAQTDMVLETLDAWARSPDRPFFLFTSYIEPHHQNDHNCYEGPIGSREKFANFVPPLDLVDHGGDWRENYPDYLGAINALDANLGRVRKKLEELGLSDSTVIVFTSDHGSHFRTRNNEYKRSCHEGCTHIPLVIYDPDYPSGQVVDSMVSLIDLPATFLDAAGLDVPEDFDGRSLKPLVEDSKGEWGDDVFMQISESQVGRAVRTRDWCYSVSAPEGDGWFDMDADVYREACLYDLKADPHEQTNLVSSGDPVYVAARKEMRVRLLEAMKKAGERPPEILPVI